MEHRYSQRFKSNSQVMIYERGMPVSTGRAVNSSRYGFFVETNHPVYNHQPLEIEIIDRSRRAAPRPSQGRRLKCFVVHAQANGFGVEIHEEQINEFSAIAAMRNFPTEQNVLPMQRTGGL